MAKYGVVSGDTVKKNSFIDNIIVLEPAQVEQIRESLGKALVEASELGLMVGDMYNGKNWTRNVDGEQVALPIETEDSAVAEYIAILEGRVP